MVTEVMCRVVDLVDVARNTRVVRLRPEAGKTFVFRAGQYAQVRFEGREPRFYSLANCPEDGGLEFHIRDNGADLVGSFVLRELENGARVEVRGPYGEAWLREDHAGPLLAVAGGSGLAPMQSIVETALRRDVSRDIHLYVGARDEADVYLDDHFIELTRRYPRLRYVLVLSAAEGRTLRRCGFVSQAVADDFPDLAGFKAHIAGPLPMVEATVAVLRAKGMTDADIHADALTVGRASVREKKKESGHE